MSDFSKRNTLLILTGILLLAFFLRLHNAGKYGIYFDEKSTLLISQGVCLEGANQKDVFTKKYFTPQEFWKPKTVSDFVEANIRGDIGNSPSYYAVLWAWMEVFGLSDLSMRLPSVLFSTLTVLLLFVFVRRHFKSDVLALISSAIAAIEPFFVAYSQMARNYSMTFFLTLLATHLFLLIMERVSRRNTDESKNQPLGLYLAYGLTFVLSVLSHYLTVTVFLCHGLYALFYLRNSRAWVTLAATGILGMVFVSLWFIFGGGKYTFQTLDYQAKFYRNIAETNPLGSPFGMILPATIPNIAKRAIPIFADLFIFTNGLGSALIGVRNSALALGLGGVFTFLIHRYAFTRQAASINPPIWLKIAPIALLLAGLPIYSVVPLRFLVLSVSVPVVYLISQYVIYQTHGEQKRLVFMLFFLAFVPTFFLLFMSWRSGHTFGITQRYSGFSFPYVCILIAMGLRNLRSLPWWFSLPITAVLLIQLGFVAQLLGTIYAGAEPKYTYFEKPRIQNPYWHSAQALQSQYSAGDTILYPNMKRMIYDEKIDKTYSPVALLDAQLVNVYLPEDAQYIQRIDPNEHDKIVLVKGKTGQKITIFDLKDVRY